MAREKLEDIGFGETALVVPPKAPERIQGALWQAPRVLTDTSYLLLIIMGRHRQAGRSFRD